MAYSGRALQSRKNNMTIPPDLLPLLRPDEIGIIPMTASSWLCMIQIGSDADKKITAFLEARSKEIGVTPPKPAPVRPTALTIPQFSPQGVAIQAIPDCAYLIVVKKGQEKGGPNETEWQLMRFVSEHGRKVPRKN